MESKSSSSGTSEGYTSDDIKTNIDYFYRAVARLIARWCESYCSPPSNHALSLHVPSRL